MVLMKIHKFAIFQFFRLFGFGPSVSKILPSDGADMDDNWLRYLATKQGSRNGPTSDIKTQPFCSFSCPASVITRLFAQHTTIELRTNPYKNYSNIYFPDQRFGVLFVDGDSQ
jgi:hypothetical protein